jgi:hypothetical protein
MTSATRAAVVSRSLTALIFAVFVVAQAPHLVHHLFEHGEATNECAFAPASERVPALAADVVAPLLLGVASLPVEAPALWSLPSHALAFADPRAPPLAS